MATEITSNTLPTSRAAIAAPATPVRSEMAPPAQQSEQKQTNADSVKLDSSKKLKDVVNDVAQAVRRDLNFSIDEDSGVTVVKVIDATSKEVVRQIPAEEMLALARRLTELSQNKPVSGEEAKGLFMATRA